MPSEAEMFLVGILSMIFFVVFAVAVGFLIYAYFTLRAANKRLEVVCGVARQSDFTLPVGLKMDAKQERAMRRSGQLFIKRRIAWFYSPDITEVWLSQMEQMGYNLYRMSKIGNSFYFLKGQPRNVKYVADYQNKALPEYYTLHQEAGWEWIFTSPTNFQKWTMWRKEYLENETAPALYTDKTTLIQHAKKMAFTFSLSFAIIAIIWIASDVFQVTTYLEFANQYPNDTSFEPLLFNILMSTLLIVELACFSLRTILYYRRVKNGIEPKQKPLHMRL